MTQVPAAPVPAAAPVPQAKTSGLAVAALILSLLICVPLGWLGFILGLVALGATGRAGVKGRGMAVTAVIVGLLATIGWGIGIFMAVKAAKAGIGQGRTLVADFVRDYNAGNDQGIYERAAPGFQQATTPEQLHIRLTRARTRLGSAEMLGFTAGAQVNTQRQNRTRTLEVTWPLRFEHGGERSITLHYVRVGDQWRMTRLDLGEAD